jgi:hypothetical protein
MNPSITFDTLSPWGHQILFLKKWFITCTNSNKIKWTLDFLIAKSSLHCKNIEACANLYNDNVTLVHRYLLFISCILCSNHFVNFLTKYLLTRKNFNLSYWVMKNWKCHVIHPASTQLLTFDLKVNHKSKTIWNHGKSMHLSSFQTYIIIFIFTKGILLQSTYINTIIEWRSWMEITNDQHILCLD